MCTDFRSGKYRTINMTGQWHRSLLICVWHKWNSPSCRSVVMNVIHVFTVRLKSGGWQSSFTAILRQACRWLHRSLKPWWSIFSHFVPDAYDSHDSASLCLPFPLPPIIPNAVSVSLQHLESFYWLDPSILHSGYTKSIDVLNSSDLKMCTYFAYKCVRTFLISSSFLVYVL